jgi:DNA invertase Pin-like site-specific DNA recombinase
MNVVAYVRVSIDTPVLDALDQAAQERAIGGWAKDHHHKLVATFADVGQSASVGLETRVALGGALAAIRDGTAHAIAVSELGYLARDVILQEQLFAEARRYGGDIVSLNAADGDASADEPSDPERRLIREVLAAVPEFEASLRDTRVRYRLGRKGIAADIEQAALARIEQLVERGLNVRDIASRLTSEGFNPRFGKLLDLSGLRKLVARWP